MRYADIKNASEDERQNQTTTRKHYLHQKNYVRFKKQNLITKSKKCQIKLKINNQKVIHQKKWLFASS